MGRKEIKMHIRMEI